MLTFLISIVFGSATGVAMAVWVNDSWGWPLFWGVLAFVAAQLSIGFMLQKKVRRTMDAVQEIMKDGQRRMQEKVNGWQRRPPSGIKAAQEELARERLRFVTQAIAASEALERYRIWSPTMGRQIATLRLQLYWMVKDYKKVDALMPRALFFDPLMVCMKLARMHMRGEKEGIDKIFAKAERRVRYGKGDLLYAVYSWILVQEGRIDEAHKVLAQGCEKSGNQTLKNNRDNLANNRIAHFNNSGFGDQWYALQLEEPKIRPQRQQPRYGRPF